MRTIKDIENCIDLIGAIINLALKDYYNGAEEKYGHLPMKELTNEQKNSLISNRTAKHFIDVKKMYPYNKFLSLNIDNIKKKYMELEGINE